MELAAHLIAKSAYARIAEYQEAYSDLDDAFKLDPELFSPVKIYVGFGLN
jgi:hypothetical protein